MTMQRQPFDYEAEAARDMCQGCAKCIYNHRPRIYVKANECPHNAKRRRLAGRKILVGQQKQGRVE